MEPCSRRKIVNICVFCGSNPGSTSVFLEAATELGRAIAWRKMHLIYGGGNLGLMGAVSRAALSEGSQVLGIIPRALANENLTGTTNGEELVVSGGLGTLEELFTVTSRGLLNIHQKPVGLLNVDNFFDFLCVFMDDTKRVGFMTKSSKDIFLIASTPEQLLDRIETFEPTVDPIFSRLNWSDDDRSKKRKSSMDLSIKFHSDN